MVKIVAVDADDTLWENEAFFRRDVQDHFAALLSDYGDPGTIHAHLLEVERRNIPRYGYGIKGFMLSMIETAVDLGGANLPATVTASILSLGQEMLNHPILLLPGVAEGLEKLHQDYRLLLVTKGDLLHQEQKIAQSGLQGLFEAVHVVSEKTPATYRAILGDAAPDAVMIGNSMKSDIVPALEIGAGAIHVPAQFEWVLERAEVPVNHPRFLSAQSFTQAVEILPRLWQD